MVPPEHQVTIQDFEFDACALQFEEHGQRRAVENSANQPRKGRPQIRLAFPSFISIPALIVIIFVSGF